MIPPEIPKNEAQRLRALRSYGILDTAPETQFDDLAKLAAHVAGVPIALVSLVDADRQWFKARYGLAAIQTPRDVSFCGHVVAAEAALVVSDAQQDARFADNPLVTGEPRVRFYAGMPLVTSDGLVLGTLCTIAHEARTLSDSQRQMLELLARQVVDQLELRRRTLKLREYALFFEMSLSLLATADATMHFRELNPAWELALGFSLAELKAEPFTRLLHPDDLLATANAIGRLQAGEALVGFENRFRHKDGHWVSLAWTAAAHDGVFFAAAVDLTRIKASQAKLVESESRLSAVFQAAVDAVITFDQAGQIGAVNHSACRLFGYDAKDFIGANVSTVLQAPGAALFDAHQAHDTHHPLFKAGNREVVATRKDRSTFLGELAISQFAVNGEPFATALVRDISERKRVERLQSEFVSTVSHELRTPLTCIRGSLGLVSAGVTGALPAEAKEYVDIALANSQRLGRLIDDLLDIEKMQHGSLEFDLRCTSLAGIIESSVVANQPFARSHGVRLVISPPVPPGEVLVDTERLMQVMANLLSNAAKFSPAGSDVEVGAERDRDVFRVTVRDHGPGIPDAFRDRLFTRFAQADGSTTREKGGSGLGLAITKNIVEKMRGKVGFHPAVGGGTVFFFELPFLQPVCTESEEIAETCALVCEDDPDAARVIIGILEAEGVRVQMAPTVERARRLLVTQTVDLVLLDLMLADGDSSALITELRAAARTRALPIIVVSGSGAALGGRAELVSDTIRKPFDEQRLRDALRVAVDGGVVPRLLHVEDDAVARKVVRRALPQTWIIDEASTVAEAKSALRASSYDVVLLDLGLPDGSGEPLMGEIGGAQLIVFSGSEASTSALTSFIHTPLVKGRADAFDVRRVITSVLTRLRRQRREAQANGTNVQLETP